jgi:hypothetical protein
MAVYVSSRAPTYATTANHSSTSDTKYLIEPQRIAIKVYLYGRSQSILKYILDASNFPLMLVIGVQIVILMELLIEVEIFELSDVLSHLSHLQGL